MREDLDRNIILGCREIMSPETHQKVMNADIKGVEASAPNSKNVAELFSASAKMTPFAIADPMDNAKRMMKFMTI